MALKFYSSVRIEVRRAAQIKQGERFIGNRVKAKIVKNKVAAPFRFCEFDIMYNEGISIAGDILDLATEMGVIKKSGNSYTYPDKKDGDIKLGVGREVAKQFLRDNQKLIKTIRKDVLDAVAVKEAAEA
jgi:recombination protein RecA